jgi:putative transposase
MPMFVTGPASERKKAFRCPRCKRARLRKDGHDQNGRQMFKCSSCGKKVSERHFSEFKGLRAQDDEIRYAIMLYMMGLSLRDVSHAMRERDVNVSHVTIRNWLIRFGKVCRKQLEHTAINYGDDWYVDEMHVKRDGRKFYIWTVRDENSQPIAAWGSSHRDSASATHLLKKALRRSKRPPKRIVTDGWRAYPKAIRKVCPGAKHVRGHIGWEITNNMSESFYGTFLRPRFNSLRNVKRCKFVNAILDLLHAWYLFARPHQSFEGKPPISQWDTA